MATIDGVIDGVNLGNNGNGASVVYPYPPYNNGGMFGNGMDGLWGLIALAIVFGGFGGNGFGFGGGGNNNMMYDINANTNRGFDQLAVTSGINDLQNAISNGFTNAEVGRCNQTTTLLQSLNSLGTQFQNCCCENRLATADLKYTVATENCADRQALAMGIRDVIESNTRNTQAILDKLCQQEIDAKNDLIGQLRSQLSMADLRASQTAQTAAIREGQLASVNSLVNELRSCPIPAQPVYGSQPIFTCPNNNGCGCGGQSIQ
jgi:hypothetical protein